MAFVTIHGTHAGLVPISLLRKVRTSLDWIRIRSFVILQPTKASLFKKSAWSRLTERELRQTPRASG